MSAVLPLSRGNTEIREVPALAGSFVRGAVPMRPERTAQAASLLNSRQLRSLWETGQSKIDARMHSRILRKLDALNEAKRPEDTNMPGFKFHMLLGRRPTRYTMHVNGPWYVTIEFGDGHACAANFEQYH